MILTAMLVLFVWQTSVVSDDSGDFTTFRRNVVELVRDILFIVDSHTLFANVSLWVWDVIQYYN